MTAVKIAARTTHTGNFAQDQAQRLAQQTAVKTNSIESRVTALERLVPVVLELAADFTTTLATAQNTKLTFPVALGDVWDVEFWGYGACSTVNGMKYAVAAPSGSVMSGELESSSTNTLVANWTTQTLVASALSAATHVGASNAGRPDRINVRVKVQAAGSITLQVASATAGDTTTLSAKALLRATRVTEV